MKLYYVPKTRAIRVAWMLEEVGATYETVKLDVSKGETRTPEYLQIHPMGKVPALVDGDLTMFESGAICLYLADKYLGKNLIAAVGSNERAEIYKWVFFATSTLEHPIVQVMAARRAKQEISADTHALLDRLWTALEVGLGDREWYVGDHFTVADLLVAAGIAWAKMLGAFKDRPKLEAFLERCMARPSFAAALKAIPD